MSLISFSYAERMNIYPLIVNQHNE